jgi:CRP-like cAMP-binding protein
MQSGLLTATGPSGLPRLSSEMVQNSGVSSQFEISENESRKEYCPLPQKPHRLESNRLLAMLPQDEYERLLPHLEHVSFALGEVIYESGGQQSYIYFPTTAIISLLYMMQNGSSAEMGVAGNEGLVGIALFMGGDTVPNRAVVQSAGEALRMKTKVLQDEFARGGTFQRLLLRYTQALMTQMSQTAVCNRLHSVEQQLCRWLLLSRDRLNSDELVMTQELIANMLGVRREGVTVAAQRLQETGLIRYVRGHIKILDQRGLEATVCECYRVVKDEYDRLLG